MNNSKRIRGVGKTLLTLLMAISFILPALTVFGTESPEATTPTGIPFSQVGNYIDQLVADHMEQYTPGMAIAIVHDGEIVFSRGYGYTDLTRQTPVNPATTVFEYGSINKLFIYTAVMQLVGQGLINLDDYVQNLLPADFYDQLNFVYPFTMRDILNHSAGFAEFMLGGFNDPEVMDEAISLRDGLLTSQPTQIFQPGTASSYSNFATALAGYIVAYIGGYESFTDFERANILQPLGMTSTKNQGDWFWDEAFMQNHARAHEPSDNDLVQTYWAYIPIYPAGSLRGTVEDLAQFAIALTPAQGENSPLFSSRTTLDTMLSPSYHDRSVMWGTYHGFMKYDAIYHALGHAGGTLGMNSEFVIMPNERFGVVVLTNSVVGANFIGMVLDLLLGDTIDDIIVPTSGLPNASAVAGNYTMLRRHEGNLFEFANIFTASIVVEAVDSNTINVDIQGMNLNLTYVQVEPYVFRLVSRGSSLARIAYEMRFIMEDGNPIGISVSGPFDATAQTFGQSFAAFIINTIMLAVGIMFFVAMPIIVLISFLRKRQNQTTFNLISNGFLLTGALLVINNVTLFLRVLSQMMATQASMVNFHIWINFALLAVSAVLLVASIFFATKDKLENKCKIKFIGSIVAMALLIFSLWNWNFFALM